MGKINNLSLPATIVIASLILGGFYYASQVSKQNSIEKQERIVAEEKKNEESKKEFLLQSCLDDAQEKYKKSVQYWLSLESQIGSSNVLKSVDKEKEVLQQDKDECYKRYN